MSNWGCITLKKARNKQNVMRVCSGRGNPHPLRRVYKSSERNFSMSNLHLSWHLHLDEHTLQHEQAEQVQRGPSQPSQWFVSSFSTSPTDNRLITSFRIHLLSLFLTILAISFPVVFRDRVKWSYKRNVDEIFIWEKKNQLLTFLSVYKLWKQIF